MAYWLIVTILAYLFFGLGSLLDKLVLVGKPKAASYTFYVGVFSLFAILIIPFIKFGLPNMQTTMWIALDAAVHVIGLYTMFLAVQKFDVSKVISTIGATQPIFVFILTWVFWGPQVTPLFDIIAFIILFAGTAIISIEKNLKLTGSYIAVTLLSSLMFSFDYIFSKFVFLNQPFLEGVIWIRIFVFLFAMVFLFSKKSRRDIFSKQVVSEKKTQLVFVAAQVCGSLANFLQSLAIALAPIAFLATVNSIRGIQYVFLFIMTALLSSFFPRILKEEISKKIIIQKAISILLIAIGLAVLVIY